MAAPSSSTHKARPMQERFDAAVKVIRSLPNEGTCVQCLCQSSLLHVRTRTPELINA